MQHKRAKTEDTAPPFFGVDVSGKTDPSLEWLARAREDVLKSPEWQSAEKTVKDKLAQKMKEDGITHFSDLEAAAQLACVRSVESTLLSPWGDFAQSVWMSVQRNMDTRLAHAYIKEEAKNEQQRLEDVIGAVFTRRNLEDVERLQRAPTETGRESKIKRPPANTLDHDSRAVSCFVNGYIPPAHRRVVYAFATTTAFSAPDELIKASEAVSEMSRRCVETFRALFTQNATMSTSFPLASRTLTHVRIVLTAYAETNHWKTRTSQTPYYVMMPLLYVWNEHLNKTSQEAQDDFSSVESPLLCACASLLGCVTECLNLMRATQIGDFHTALDGEGRPTFECLDFQKQRDDVFWNQTMVELNKIDHNFALKFTEVCAEHHVGIEWTREWLCECVDRLFVGVVPLDVNMYIIDCILLTRFKLITAIAAAYLSIIGGPLLRAIADPEAVEKSKSHNLLHRPLPSRGKSPLSPAILHVAEAKLTRSAFEQALNSRIMPTYRNKHAIPNLTFQQLVHSKAKEG